MEANELRIGNYVQSRIEVGQKWDIIVSANDLIGNYKLFEPIPLTEDWLVKFGFRITDSESNLNLTYAKKDGFCINTYQEEKVGYWWLGFYHNNKNKHIQYVHQLQNLYFALTNEELTLNP